MGVYTTRLGCQLSFNEEQESDIIKVIEHLNSTHKTGHFLSNLIRIALESPEIIDKGNGKFKPGDLIKHMDACGITYNRKTFMMSVTKDISDMKQRIDQIYEMAMKMYTLSIMGKHLGLDKKSDNVLISTFILERQLKDLQTSLGINISDPIYASNKLDESHERANNTLEYIITTYTGIIEELKNMIAPVQIEIPVIQQVITSVPVTENQDSSSINVNHIIDDTSKILEESSELEVVDFGNSKPKPEMPQFIKQQEDLNPNFENADMDAIDKFMGW